MDCEYLLKEEGSIIDTIRTKKDLELKENYGLVWQKEFYMVDAIDFFVDADQSKRIYIVNVRHIPFEQLTDTIRTKMLWSKF
jgi:hypothetical protein